MQHHLSLEHAHSFDIMNLTELEFSAITLAFKKAQPTYFASRDTVLHPSLPAAFGTHKDFKAQLHSVRCSGAGESTLTCHTAAKRVEHMAFGIWPMCRRESVQIGAGGAAVGSS